MCICVGIFLETIQMPSQLSQALSSLSQIMAEEDVLMFLLFQNAQKYALDKAGIIPVY